MAALIIIRGNSGSGKSSIAKELRKSLKNSKVSIVAQDIIRREVLADLGEVKKDNVELIELIINFSLRKNYITIVEGIYGVRKYKDMFQRVMRNSTSNYVYYLDILFEETIRRHATKLKKNEFGEKEMKQWYREKDLLGFDNEIVIGPNSRLEESVDFILERL
jgi:adenylylsulfate kinase-like enzyme